LHAFCVAVHAPAMHARPAPQSFVAVQGQGPDVPPHAWHTFALHVAPAPQSVVVVHSFFGPGALPGGEQKPVWHVSPFGQVASLVQLVVQPVAVHTLPAPQLALPVQLGCAAAVVGAQPYASHVKHPVLSQ
jgi:hypothetical protein